MPKSQPFSIRLSPGVDALVTLEARRTRRSKGAIVEMLADEALRTRRFPGLAFRGADWNRRAWIIGTGLDVWEIVAAARKSASPQTMAAETDLNETQIRLALVYAHEYADEIDDAIRESETSLEQLQRAFPAFDTVTAVGPAPGSAPTRSRPAGAAGSGRTRRTRTTSARRRTVRS